MTDDDLALNERIERRIAQAENRLLKWLVGLCVGLVLSASVGLVAFGALTKTVTTTDARVTKLEVDGSPPVRVSIAGFQERLSANSNLLLIMQSDLRTIRDEVGRLGRVR